MRTKSFLTAALCVAIAAARASAAIYTIDTGSTFYDASTGLTSNIGGTITTHLIDYTADYGPSDPYYRQQIDSIVFTGNAQLSLLSLSVLPFGQGAIDVTPARPGLFGGQIQIIVGDYNTRFGPLPTPSTMTLTGAYNNPTTITLLNLYPFEATPSTGLESADRLSLYLTTTPEPATLGVLAIGTTLALRRRRW